VIYIDSARDSVVNALYSGLIEGLNGTRLVENSCVDQELARKISESTVDILDDSLGADLSKIVPEARIVVESIDYLDLTFQYERRFNIKLTGGHEVGLARVVDDSSNIDRGVLGNQKGIYAGFSDERRREFEEMHPSGDLPEFVFTRINYFKDSINVLGMMMHIYLNKVSD